LNRGFCLGMVGFVFLLQSGCASMVNYFAVREEGGNAWEGTTYYVGGAGPIGHVGSFDVPTGLRDAGYTGFVKVFTWQSMNHAGDQINLERNRLMAAKLAASIKRYRRSYPHAKINIIALSAGTGIATFAIEFLPEDMKVDNVVFLGCSLSSRYDLTRALKRIRGKMYILHSPHDRILKDVVWYTGTIDRSSASDGIAGLRGVEIAEDASRETRRQYRKLRNIPYRHAFAESGYDGGHTDGARRAFVRDYIADVLMGNDRRLVGGHASELRRYVPAPLPATGRPTSRPASTSRPTAASRPSG